MKAFVHHGHSHREKGREEEEEENEKSASISSSPPCTDVLDRYHGDSAAVSSLRCTFFSFPFS